MRSIFFTPVLFVLGGFLLVGSVVTAAERARIVTIEGSTAIYQVYGREGQLVTVAMPSQSLAEVDVDKTVVGQQDNASGTVEATIVSLDKGNSHMKVRTTKGQILRLEVPPESLDDMRLGETLTLVVPHQ